MTLRRLRHPVRGFGRATGIALLATLVLLLWIGLKLARGGEHPLALAADIDLCRQLGSDVWSRVPGPHGAPQSRAPGFESGGAATCFVALDEPPPDAQPARYLRVAVMTQRMLAPRGGRLTTGQYVETFSAEARADGSRVETVAGPWRAAWLIVGRSPDSERQLLADEGGIVLWVAARGVDSGVMVDFAGAAARRLRHGK